MSVEAPLKKTTMTKIAKKIEQELYDVEERLSYLEKAKESKTSTETKLDHPDARMHQIVSFIKSGIRILGYILIPFSLPWAAGILVASEVVGIIEELV